MILHHASVPVRSLAASRPFYRDGLSLTEIERPPFKSIGAWFVAGECQVHLIEFPGGSFRQHPMHDPRDAHMALRTENFAEALMRLNALGYREDAAEGDPRRIFVRREGAAGFPQAFVLDPDWNLIEINAIA